MEEYKVTNAIALATAVVAKCRNQTMPAMSNGNFIRLNRLGIYILGVVNGPLKNKKSRQTLLKSRNLAQPSYGSRSLRFYVCRSHICFSIKSLNFSVSVSDCKVPCSLGVSASLGFTFHHPSCSLLIKKYTLFFL